MPKEFTDVVELLIYIVPLSFIGGCAASAIDRTMYNRKYERAQIVAAQTFGDRVQPLTQSEMQDWYDTMGVHKGKEPTRKQLNQFLDDVVKSP
jgi:hypothetical protein